MRINQFLAACNLGSRRKVEALIEAGKVSCNGVKIDKLAFEVNSETDYVQVNGQKVEPLKEQIYLLMNKPKKYIVSKNDEFGRKTVFDLLSAINAPLFAAGRLDYDSEGLLIISSDGEFINKIIHGKHKFPKTYRVDIKGQISEEELATVRRIDKLGGQKVTPAKIYIKEQSLQKTQLKVVIYEGRNRQIHKLLEKVDKEVVLLRRLAIGPLQLGNLPIGMVRPLLIKEINALEKLLKMRIT